MEGDLQRMEASGTGSEREENASIPTEDPDITLATSIRKKLQTVSTLSSRYFIHKVPKKLHNLNDAAYTPQVISIGPFHHGQESLQIMQEHKWRYMDALIDLYPQIDLEGCVKALRGLEERARQCYAEPIKLGSDEFVEMMLLDGFFILLLFLQEYYIDLLEDTIDPVYDTTWMFSAIMRDMILLENQIPFFVLEQLFLLSVVPNQDDPCPSLLELTLVFFKYLLKIDEIPETISTSQVQHLLDFIRSCLLPSSITVLPDGDRSCDVTRSATELHEAGVKFRMGESNCLLDISFRNGVLEIPSLKIEDWTESIFRNLIALEQCQKLPNSGITSYASLLDSLINTPKDVSLLIHYGIIENWLGDDEEVSHLFNNLVKEVILETEKFYFSSLCEELNAHCKMRRHRWMASLRHDYFNTPWAIISFNAAVALLILTFIQTRKNPCSFTMEGDLTRMGASATISEKHDRGDNASIQTENLDVTLATSIQQKLNIVSPLSSVCYIHKVSMMLRSINEAIYIPLSNLNRPIPSGQKELTATNGKT
ncbi:hypothetical protein HHK36_033256 [Tetracentron sinense]|uniref:Uncharacterized protein n=1 Tax=Tetracentron sinense TaxID=13715 RepID=A0A834Y9N8_TETSI|nr:hypothetical protein HHK36_033256 [Tetracentron sinense]